ncbi:MAG TPA: class I SAM-dependent methyltransferase [Candidatus Acidoferrum sp.]|nr:class I SAM-dependent methyltransferase [Candidatus Acidoferrum sp.]
MQTGAAPSHDDLAANYDRQRSSPPFELYEILREHGLVAGRRVLDVGVGTGLASEPLASAGVTITGIDPSPEMLAGARARLPQAELVTGRAESLPFGPASFDAAISGDVFPFVDQSAALAELLRVVRKGGTVAIWSPTISTESEILAHRIAASLDLGLEPIRDPASGGFRSFYAAPFAARAVRVVPTLVRATVHGWMSLEFTRAEVRSMYGARARAWLDALGGRLVRAYGSPDAPLTVRLVYYLYLGTV